MKRAFLHFLFSIVLIYGAFAEERFWVGGSGNWNDNAHWSQKSGGPAGASIPTSTDNVNFDVNSFSQAGPIVFVSENAACKNMNWKQVLHTPDLSGKTDVSLTISGSLFFTDEMTNHFGGTIVFASFQESNTIHTAGHLLLGDVVFDGERSTWNASGEFSCKRDIQIFNGIFNCNNQTIRCNSVIRKKTYQSAIIGFSKIFITEGWKFLDGSNESSIDSPSSSNYFFDVTDKNSVQKPPLFPATTNTVQCIVGTYTIVLTITGTDLTCNGNASGTASVTVTGGVPPYTYNWLPSNQTTSNATGLNAGTHTIEVYDNTGINFCSGPITINEPAVLSVNITPPSPVTSCFGICDGSATANVSGGTPAYTYAWNTVPIQTTASATGLCSGTQTVIITDAQGCTRSKLFVVGQPPVLLANGSSVNVTCFGFCNGFTSVTPTGGNPPYTYAWLPSGITASAITALCPSSHTCTVTDSKGCKDTYTTTITQPPLLTATVTGTNLLCNGVCTGSVTATVSGGTPSYTYSWAPGGATTSAVTGLCANTYTLTITDGNNCVLTKTVTLTQPSSISSAPSGTNVSCFGQCDGVVNANAAGGTAPYTYLWSPGGCTTSSCSNLCNGTYSVNVNDANGCATTGTISITQPALLTVSLSKTDILCSGLCNGNVTATASGGTLPYTYAWSPGGCTTSACAGLCAGTYSITVTDAKGCTATGTVTITSPLPLLSNLSSTSASCSGICDGSVSSSASGGTLPYTYSWSSGCTTSACSGLCAGTYTLTLTDANACVTTSTITVSQPNPISVSISSATPNPLNCNGDCNGTAVASVLGGTPTYTYLWSPGGETTASATGLCAGTYTIAVTDTNGCNASTTISFIQPSILAVNTVKVNPSCSGACNGSISAIAGGGTPGYTFLWLPGGQSTAGIAGQCAGTYTLTVSDSKGCSNTQTITLTAPPTLAANASIINNVLCAGQCNGSATASPAGGTAPFSYLWTGGSTAQTITGLCAGTISVTVTDANGCNDIDIITITQPPVLSSSISSSTSSCSLCNGTATVSTSGGTVPYTYLWSPGGNTTSAAAGLCVGTYTISITDANGCANSVTATINPVVTISVTVSGTSVSCPGMCDGVATATPFGGGVPYTYLWAPSGQTTQSATGFCTGTYSVSVSDINGCLSTSTVTFTSPTPLSSVMSSTSASCGVCNGTATAAPSGGTGGYTYLWSGLPIQTTATATGLCPGNYTVSISDANNCAVTNTVTVGNIPAIAANPTVVNTACGTSNGSICLAPSGGTPSYTYLWAPGGATTSCITGLTAGIYSVTITDAAACINSSSIAVSNIGALTLSVTTSVNPLCNNDCNGSASVTSSGGVGSLTYLWTPGGQTTTSVTGMCAGNYIAQVIDAVPCTSLVAITLTNPAQLNSNPTIINVSCKGGNNGSICLSPTGGSGSYTYTWSNGQSTSCITGLTAGTYSVILADATGCDDTIAIPISEPALLSVSITPSNVTCNGNCDGTATANVVGGTTLYTYSWSTGSPLPGIVGLCPNNYSVTVTDSKGCIATASVAITQPAVLTTTATSTNITCNSLCDGTAAITVGGGTVPYSYSWLPGSQTTSAITGLCVGAYIGTVTDANGCAVTSTVTITQPTAISATVTPSNVTCFGGCNGSATVAINGGTGAYTYLWNPGGATTSSVTGLCAASYTLTILDANGCNNTQLFSITTPAVLQTNITNSPPTCSYNCNATATSSPVGGTGSYTYQWSTVPVQTTAMATGLCPGTYSLTLFDSNGCSITQTTNIIAPSPVSVSWGAAGATCKVCNGSVTVVSSGGSGTYSYSWVSGQTTATITGLCAGLYFVTVTDANGCTADDTIPVSNTTGPAIAATGTNITCFGACNGTATVTITAAGDGPPWGYLWTPSAQTTSSATGLCPAQYFIGVTDTIGCVTYDTVSITQPAALASNPTASNATCFGICNGSIALNPSGGTGAYTYSWLPGGQTTSSIAAQCTGNYSVTITDANNCALTTTISIGQNTILTSTVASTNDSCNASCDGTASIALAGGTSPYTYAWTGGQTTSTATGLCVGNYVATVTDFIGCLLTNTATITEPAVITPTFTLTNPLCNGSCNGAASVAVSGGTGAYTYLWNPGAATTTSVTGLCAQTLTLTITDANKCSVTNTVSLTNPAFIASTHTVTNASCNNTSDGSASIMPTGGTGTYTFIWSPGNQTTQNITGIPSGIYSVTITDANGCAFTDSMTVGATTVVTANAGSDVTFCIGGTATLCSSSLNATSLAWYQLPGWTLIGNTNCVNQSPPAGNNTYALIAFNGVCMDTDTVVVTVDPLPILVPPANASICLGDSVQLCAAGATTYQWFVLPAWTPLASGSCITVTPGLGTTSYGIVGFNGLCSDSDSVAVTVLLLPIADAGNDTSNCFGNNHLLCSNSINSTSVAWYSLPSWIQIDTTSCITVSPPVGTNTYVLVASNGMCSDTDTVSVIINPTPVVDAGVDVTIVNGGSTVLNGTGSGTYIWSPATGLSSTTIANPTANPTLTTTYTLVVTDPSGCFASDSVRVTVVNTVIPFDGISPNDDGINDVWEIPNIEQFPNCLVEVYNRWGELLFSSIGYKEKWNGTYKGKELPVGSYYYVINLNDALYPDPITGPITILR